MLPSRKKIPNLFKKTPETPSPIQPPTLLKPSSLRTTNPKTTPAMKMERKSAQTVQVGFYLNGDEKAAFGGAEMQMGKLWFSVDRNGSIWIDNVTVKGKIASDADGGGADKAEGLKRLTSAGWQVDSGEWSMSTDGVITGRSVGGKPAVISRRIARPFHLVVSMKGSGEYGGVSFGDKKDFGLQPSDKWQKISVKVDLKVDWSFDDDPHWGTGDHTGVRTPEDVGGTVSLKANGTVEFKGFDVMPLK